MIHNKKNVLLLCLLSFFPYNLKAAINLSVGELVSQKDHFSRTKEHGKASMKEPYQLYKSRKFLKCYEKTNDLIKKKEFKSFHDDLLSLMITCYVSTPRKSRPQFNIEYNFFENPVVVKKLFRDMGHDTIRKIIDKGELQLDSEVLRSHFYSNPSGLCLFNAKPDFVKEVTQRIAKLDNFYSLSIDRFPCGLNLGDSYKGFLEDKETYSLYLKKGLRALKKRPGLRFKYIKRRIGKREYSKFRRLNKERSRKYISSSESLPDYIINRIARNLFFRGKYDLLERFEKNKYLPLEAMSYVVKAKISRGDDDEALLLTKDLKVEPSEWVEEILLIRGGIYLRKKNFDLAEIEFSKMLENSKDLRLSALYWNWVVLKRQKKLGKAKKISKFILKEYPFSYYGLLVANHYEGKSFFEKYNKKYTDYSLSLKSLSKKDSDRLTEYYLLGWKKAFSGVYQEVEESLSSKEKALFALVFYNMGETRNTIKILNKEWDVTPELRAQPFISTSFSFMYSDAIIKESAKHKELNSAIVRAIIRQESAFHKNAKSGSGAKGLMQLMNPTAREVARQLRVRNFNPNRNSYDSDLNIKLGSKYMSRLIFANKGYLPYAFASYNAGPGKMNRWSSKRDSVYNLKKGMDFRKESELDEFWVEELPWVETRFYAKALLRNMGIYMALSGQKKSFSCEPFWSCL